MHPLTIMLHELRQGVVLTTKKSYRLSQQPLPPPIIETLPPDPPAPPKEKKPKVPKQKKSKVQLKQERIQKNLDTIQKKADAFKMSLQCIDANKEVNQERKTIHGKVRKWKDSSFRGDRRAHLHRPWRQGKKKCLHSKASCQ